MERLISMTAFVLADMYSREGMVKYANFLKQPLTLGMFAPCDDNGNILEEPNTENHLHGQDSFVYHRLQAQYQEAKKRVLFEGFEVKHEKFMHDKLHFYIEHNGIKFMWNFNNKWEFYKEFSTIEDLVKYNLVLTESARKHLGL